MSTKCVRNITVKKCVFFPHVGPEALDSVSASQLMEDPLNLVNVLQQCLRPEPLYLSQEPKGLMFFVLDISLMIVKLFVVASQEEVDWSAPHIDPGDFIKSW